MEKKKVVNDDSVGVPKCRRTEKEKLGCVGVKVERLVADATYQDA